MKLSVLYTEPVISENLYDKLEDMLKTSVRRVKEAVPVVGAEAKRRRAAREAEGEARAYLDLSAKIIVDNLKARPDLDNWQVAKIAKYLNQYKDQQHVVDQVVASKEPFKAAADMLLGTRAKNWERIVKDPGRARRRLGLPPQQSYK
ncbi:MAG: hypothetical protein ACW963_02595 [Candidatus Sifarchaeia archaeon]|jgi:hypothetical protein